MNTEKALSTFIDPSIALVLALLGFDKTLEGVFALGTFINGLPVEVVQLL